MALWQDGDVVLEEGKLHYYRTGGGKPPILLLHGLTDSGLCWTRLAEVLEADYDLIMPDARGHGLSSDFPATKFALKDMAIDLIKIIQKLGLKTMVILGHSMGGRVAAYVGAAVPAMVSKLVLEDPAWNEKFFSQTKLERFMIADTLRTRIRNWRNQSPQQIITTFRRDQSLNWHKTDYMTWADAKMQVSPNVMGVWQAEPVALEEIVPKIACPTLLMWGDVGMGAIQDEQTARQMHDTNPKIEMVHIPGAGHDIHRDKFDVFLQTVKDFLAK